MLDVLHTYEHNNLLEVGLLHLCSERLAPRRLLEQVDEKVIATWCALLRFRVIQRRYRRNECSELRLFRRWTCNAP